MTDQAVKTKSPRFRRKRAVIRPALQIKVSLIFVSVMAVALVLFAAQVFHATRGLSGEELREVLDDLLLSKLLASLALGAGLTIAVAIIVTFRIAGPVFRMRSFLNRVRDGEQTTPCTLRKGDAFGDLCQAINEATEPLRNPTNHTPAPAREPEAAAV